MKVQKHHSSLSLTEISSCHSHLCVFKSILQIAITKTSDVACILLGEASYSGREVESEGQLDQLGCCWWHGGSCVGRRCLVLQISIGQPLEGGVRHPQEKVAQSWVPFKLEEI